MNENIWDNISKIIEEATEELYTKYPDMMNEIMALNKKILDGIAEFFPEEEKKKYKLINDNDGNDQIELQSTSLEDAIDEAFQVLGWNLVVSDFEE